jgi:hypothetical protein
MNFMSLGFSYYSGKLYEKGKIIAWDLPADCKAQLQMDKYKNFFFASVQVEENKDNNIHFTIYPTNNDHVYYVEVKMEKIVPEILHKTLNLLRNYEMEIIKSTGICLQAQFCYFGIFFSKMDCIETEEIAKIIREMEGTLDVKLFCYSTEGCCEI